MNNARIITVASVALCAMGLRAAVPGAATPTWWGVINNHLEARFQKDGGATTTYRAYVKYAGESEFSKLGDVARTSGTGGQIVNLAVDGTRFAERFRVGGIAFRHFLGGLPVGIGILDSGGPGFGFFVFRRRHVGGAGDESEHSGDRNGERERFHREPPKKILINNE